MLSHGSDSSAERLSELGNPLRPNGCLTASWSP